MKVPNDMKGLPFNETFDKYLNCFDEGNKNGDYAVWLFDQRFGQDAGCFVNNSYGAEDSIFERVIENGLYNVVKHILINYQNVYLDHELVDAAICHIDDMETIKIILDKFEYFRLEDYWVSTPKEVSENANAFTYAVSQNRLETAHFIIDNYPNICCYNDDVCSTITKVMEHTDGEDIELVRKIAERDPDLNRLYYGMFEYPELVTVGYELCYNYTTSNNPKNYLEAIKILLQNGASVHQFIRTYTEIGTTLPDKSSAFGGVYQGCGGDIERCKPLFDLLIENGFDPTKKLFSFNEMPIMEAIQRNQQSDEATVDLLNYTWAIKPFDVNDTNILNGSLLLGAAQIGKPKTVKWLYDKGASLHHIGGHDDSTALHKSINFYYEGDKLGTVKMLLDLGMDVNLPDPNNGMDTPLMDACSGNHVDIAKLLIERGANVNTISAFGKSAITAIIDSNTQTGKSISLLELLAANGADLNIKNNKEHRPLNVALLGDEENLFIKLLQLGADPSKEEECEEFDYEPGWFNDFIEKNNNKPFTTYDLALYCPDQTFLNILESCDKKSTIQAKLKKYINNIKR